MKHFIVFIVISISISAFSQKKENSFTNRTIVKTNLLSLIAQRPTISVEKFFSNNFSAELSFVQGEFNYFLLTDRYRYVGFLLRVKEYDTNIKYGAINPYTGFYLGSLIRNIETEGALIGNSGWFGYPSRIFTANSIRGGVSFGSSYFSKSRWVIDGQCSLGYGRYINIDKSDPGTYFTGYLDLQVWLSVGYRF